MAGLAELLAAPIEQNPAQPPEWWNRGVRNVAGGVGRGLADLLMFPGQYASGQTGYQPGQMASEQPRATQWAPEMATNMVGAPAMTGGVPGMGSGIRAYHGSPHDFDRFDLSRIGTGEGAQAYGHGLYFAENPKVAEEYKKNVLNMPAIRSGNQRLTELSREMDALAVPGQYRKFREPRGYELAAEYDRVMAEKMRTAEQPGKMYEVNINAKPEQFLDWDKPIHKQGPDVARALDDVYPGMIQERTQPGKSPTIASAFPYGIRPQISEALNKSGIPGIKYLDQGSRGAGAGTSNYVLFNDQIIDILRKYGLAPAAATPLAQTLLDGQKQ